MIDKIKKFLAVLFLTLLIWTSAFLSLERNLSLIGSLHVAPTTPSNLMVSFLNENDQVITDNLKLDLDFRGAPTKVSELDKRYRATDQDPQKERLDFYYNPADYEYTQPGIYTLDILELVRNSLKARDLALTVSTCDPRQIRVRIEGLTSKDLPVEIRDENNNPIQFESIEPSRIRMFVPQEYTGPAIISLTAQQIVNARGSSILERPQIPSFGDRPGRYSSQYVKIRLPSTEPLKDQVFQPKRIGYILPPDIEGRYRVELLNESDLKTMNFKATDEAKQLYEQQSYHLLIQVLEGDENLNPIPPRPVIYDFPRQMIRQRLIQEPNPPVQVRIRLVPIASGTPAS